jgi:hypothetical protein
MLDNIGKSKEEAKKVFELIFQRCVTAKWGSCSERDTLTKFIHPALVAFGWDVRDFNDMREEILAKPEGKGRLLDIVLYTKGKPYIGIEVKSLSYGPIIDETKENVRYLLRELLQKSRYLCVKYAVLTRFAETLIFDPETGNKLASFGFPQDHLGKFNVLWDYLSKPR